MPSRKLMACPACYGTEAKYVLNHFPRVVKVKVHGSPWYRVECRCGFKAGYRWTEGAAIELHNALPRRPGKKARHAK